MSRKLYEFFRNSKKKVLTIAEKHDLTHPYFVRLRSTDFSKHSPLTKESKNTLLLCIKQLSIYLGQQINDPKTELSLQELSSVLHSLMCNKIPK